MPLNLDNPNVHHVQQGKLQPKIEQNVNHVQQDNIPRLMDLDRAQNVKQDM